MLLINLPEDLAKEVIVYYKHTDVFLDLAKDIDGTVIPSMLGIYTSYPASFSRNENEFWEVVYSVTGVE